MAKILIAEDDLITCEMISDWFSQKGHTVEVVGNGRDAMELLRVACFDLIILDWQLPHLSGIEVINDFRAAGGQTPILMLTAMQEMSQKELGLYSGADDYLTKPFQMRELAARTASLLRRPPNFFGKVLKLRDIELDTATRKVTKAGHEVHLLPKEYALFEFFLLHPNQLFSPEMLLERVWSSDSDSTSNAIVVAMRRLRQKLDDPGSESIITTVRGSGYVLRRPD